MKKLIKACLIVVVVFMMLQAMIGGAFVPSDKMVSFENPQYVTAPSSGQSIQILICVRGRVAGCVLPNVGWNS